MGKKLKDLDLITDLGWYIHEDIEILQGRYPIALLELAEIYAMEGSKVIYIGTTEGLKAFAKYHKRNATKLPCLLSNKDAINPRHYNQHSIECIEFTRYMDFSTGNAFKYLWRCGLKDAPEQEVKKAIWYLKDALKHIENINCKVHDFPKLPLSGFAHGREMEQILEFHKTGEDVYLKFALGNLEEL